MTVPAGEPRPVGEPTTVPAGDKGGDQTSGGMCGPSDDPEARGALDLVGVRSRSLGDPPRKTREPSGSRSSPELMRRMPPVLSAADDDEGGGAAPARVGLRERRAPWPAALAPPVLEGRVGVRVGSGDLFDQTSSKRASPAAAPCSSSARGHPGSVGVGVRKRGREATVTAPAPDGGLTYGLEPSLNI